METRPGCTRKVVLDEEIIKHGKLSQVTTKHHMKLLSKFLGILERECNVARQLDQPVLILIFAHGKLPGTRYLHRPS